MASSAHPVSSAEDVAGPHTRAVTEPHGDDDHENNLHPGQQDHGGHGGMATREQDAREEDGPAED